VTLNTGPGSWFLESPFRPALDAENGGTLQLADLSLGLHTLFSSEGSRIRLSVGKSDLILIHLRRMETTPGRSRRRDKRRAHASKATIANKSVQGMECPVISLS